MAGTPWVQPPRLRSVEEAGGERHATWLELFFDLVFVVAVAGLSHLISDDPSAKSFLRYAVLFVPVWFVWVAFTAYADRFDTDDLPHRLLMLDGMLATVALAIHVDDAFEGGSAPFALFSVLVRLPLLAMYVRAARAVPAVRDYQAFYVKGWSLALVLWAASIFVPDPAAYVLWGVAVLIEVLTPLAAERRVGTVPLHASHIEERFALFTLIVLGESVVSVAAGIARVNFDLTNSTVAVASFVLAAALAWLYFDRLGSERGGRPFWVYSHFFVFAGLGAVAPGTLLAIESAHDSALPAGARVALCGGVALYLLALALVAAPNRRTPGVGRQIAARCLAGGAGVAVLFAGAALPPVVTVLLLAAVVVADLVYELVVGGAEQELPLEPLPEQA
jgi:low temperature requirement protein LtrA